MIYEPFVDNDIKLLPIYLLCDTFSFSLFAICAILRVSSLVSGRWWWVGATAILAVGEGGGRDSSPGPAVVGLQPAPATVVGPPCGEPSARAKYDRVGKGRR